VSIDVERARAETPGCRHRIHLNNCGAALMPAPVVDAVKAHLDLEARIGGYEAAAEAAEQVEDTYLALAGMLGCAPEEIAVVENATRGWDMAFYAMPFSPGDRILTSVAEYASNYIAFLQVARRTGAVVEPVPNDPYGALDVGALDSMIDERVKLIAVTHVPTNGGLVNPGRAIGIIARKHGIPYLLDACQSAGQMPLDVEEFGVDMLSATSRKFLRGPRGCGFLYVRKEWAERLEPPFLDLHAATWTAPGEYTLRPDARRFENWECNVAAKIGFGRAVEYALDWGLEEIRERVTALAEDLRAGLEEIPGVRVRDLGRNRCGIVSFTPGDHAPREVLAALRLRGINASVSSESSTVLDMRGRGIAEVVRAGVHYYNSEEEIARFLEVVREIVTRA